MILFVPLSNPSTSNAVRGFEAAANPQKDRAPVVTSRYRERDYGIGYGNSSGYASGRSYANHSARPYFRCG